MQAILVYTMGIFKIPKGIISKLNDLLEKFWWRYTEHARKNQWLDWGKMGLSKKERGLGFREL